MRILGLILPVLQPLIDKLTNVELIKYLKEQLEAKDKQISKLTTQLTKKFKSKGKNESL